MSTKLCKVIQDLLPLYIDNICSNESHRMVSEHIENCYECKKLYENMNQAVKQDSIELELDSKQAFSAINHKWRMKNVAVMFVSVVLTAIVFFVGCMVVQNVAVVHDFFFPVTYADLRNLPDDEWQRISFNDSDVLIFDSIFYNKEVTLHANSDGPIGIRIFDKNGNMVVEETVIEPGTGLKLDTLRNNIEYVVEIKTTADFVLLNFY